MDYLPFLLGQFKKIGILWIDIEQLVQNGLMDILRPAGALLCLALGAHHTRGLILDHGADGGWGVDGNTTAAEVTMIPASCH